LAPNVSLTLLGRDPVPPFVPSRAYKRARECLDFLIENGEGRSSALTMRLPSSGVSSAAPYHFDLIGGKEGTRTLDPGIMSTRVWSRLCRLKLGDHVDFEAS